MKKPLSAAVLAVLCSSLARAANAPEVANVNAALNALHFPAGATVLSVSRAGGALRVDFSTATAIGLTDASLEELADAVRSDPSNAAQRYELTAGGRPLSDCLPPVPSIMAQDDVKTPRAAVAGALSGKVICLSPGHGWTYYGATPVWDLQRSYFYGIVEDYMNQEMIQYVYNLLVNNGATVYTTREMEKSYGTCSTAYTFAGVNRPAPNKPWWQMAALYYSARVGAPTSVYDNGTSDDYNRDIRCRGLYSNWRKADIMVSLHNNASTGKLNPDGSVASPGTSSGTLTLYDTGNGYTVTNAAQEYGSQYLAQKVQGHVLTQLRTNYNANWVDQTAEGFAGSYGENRIPQCPACLVETAFFDHPTPDSAALHDENYRMLVAKGIYEGICEYFHVTPTYNTHVTALPGTFKAAPMAALWSLKLGAPVLAPPSSAGGWVYAATDAGVLYGVAATAASGFAPGTLKWRYPAASTLGAAMRARPAVYGNTVFAVSIAGKMVAVNRLTGAFMWQATVPNKGGLVTAPAATPDGRLIIGSDNGKLYTYRQSNGALVSTSTMTFGAINAPVAVPDTGHMWVSSDDGSIRCLTSDSSTVLWLKATGAAVKSAPFVAASENAVYFTNTAGSVFAINASNGQPAPGWNAGGAVFNAPINTSPWVDAAGGTVMFGLDNHTLAGVTIGNATPLAGLNYHPLGVKEFTASPIVANSTLYDGGNDGRFYALRLGGGATPVAGDWRVFDAATDGLPGPFTATPCLTGISSSDVAVAGNNNGTLYAFPL